MRHHNMLIGATMLVWAIGIAIGFGALARYQSAPGEPASPAATWPNDVPISHNPDKPTLLIFAHPKCPCTRATIEELDRIMVVGESRVDARVVFFTPEGAGDDWADGALRRRASGIPGVTVLIDKGGAIGRAFGAATSGQTLLHDETGSLVFSGGITNGRGHEGGNPGRDAVKAFLRARETPTSSTPVFGCRIMDSDTGPAPPTGNAT